MAGFLGLFNPAPKNALDSAPKNTVIPFTLINQTRHFATIKVNRDFLFLGKPVRELDAENEVFWYEYLYENHNLMFIKGRFRDGYVVCQKLCETIVSTTALV